MFVKLLLYRNHLPLKKGLPRIDTSSMRATISHSLENLKTTSVLTKQTYEAALVDYAIASCAQFCTHMMKKLPRELRDLVYQNLLPSGTSTRPAFQTREASRMLRYLDKHYFDSAFVGDLVRRELLQNYQSTTTLEITNKNLQEWPVFKTAPLLNGLRSIRIDFSLNFSTVPHHESSTITKTLIGIVAPGCSVNIHMKTAHRMQRTYSDGCQVWARNEELQDELVLTVLSGALAHLIHEKLLVRVYYRQQLVFDSSLMAVGAFIVSHTHDLTTCEFQKMYYSLTGFPLQQVERMTHDACVGPWTAWHTYVMQTYPMNRREAELSVRLEKSRLQYWACLPSPVTHYSAGQQNKSSIEDQEHSEITLSNHKRSFARSEEADETSNKRENKRPRIDYSAYFRSPQLTVAVGREEPPPPRKIIRRLLEVRIPAKIRKASLESKVPPTNTIKSELSVSSTKAPRAAQICIPHGETREEVQEVSRSAHSASTAAFASKNSDSFAKDLLPKRSRLRSGARQQVNPRYARKR
ncbi:hypothetical protein BDV96DRAFT_634236 [Lophiotrema nucula]|uniref:Uncharacterized protein n=1 Tax=Lophiotrema nucula TaxID=690887 RepID=A0A6A5YZH7_9PLEO|nr:hypothetical protein BDV96DRAFT_634236 [Lophiotrema nucula]